MKSNQDSGFSMGLALLIAFGALTVLAGAAIIWSGEALARFAFIVPIIFLFIAIGAFLLLLLHYAYTLNAINPTLPVGALGLPEGSIRAFLTIGLLALVAVFGTFIYFETGRAQPVVMRSQVPVATGEQLAEIQTSVGNRFLVIPLYKDGKLVFADIVSAEPDTARSDVAKQLLTMIATVLTTVIGFYFGSRTTEGARGPDPAEMKRRIEALIEMSPWTQDLDAREKALLEKADEAAAKARKRGDAAAEAKTTELKGQLPEAFAALRAAQKAVSEMPEDVAAVLATRDKAREALAVLKTTQEALDAMVQAGDLAAAGTARSAAAAADATPPAP